MTRPTPGELWAQAGGDRDTYRQLMHEHGHLVARQPDHDGNLPCGWPGRRAATVAPADTENEETSR